MLRVPTCMRSAYSATRSNVFLAHGFGNDREPGFFPSFAQKLQAIETEALEGIRRRARFIGASAEKASAGGSHGFGGTHQLALRFDRAGPSHHDEIAAAYFYITGANDDRGATAGLGDEIEAGKLAIPFRVHKWQTEFYPAGRGESLVGNH